MDLISSVNTAFNALGKPIKIIGDEFHLIIKCSPKLYVHLIPLHTSFQPQELVELQEKYQKKEALLVHLWEDVWQLNKAQVLNRIKSFLGLNETFHARKAKLVEIESPQAKQFYNNYHLQGYVKAKFHFGLSIDKEIISMASFSDLRPMKLKGNQYTSAELVRFASKDGYTVTGGLSKLIKHFLKMKKPNDLMSYADRDWSLGLSYQQLGFELSAITPPVYLYIDEVTKQRYFAHRLPKKTLLAFNEQNELNLSEFLAKQGFARAFNTGNLKYHLYVK